MFSCFEIRVPGTFVVMHGLAGDGLKNTMDGLPEICFDDDDNCDEIMKSSEPTASNATQMASETNDTVSVPIPPLDTVSPDAVSNDKLSPKATCTTAAPALNVTAASVEEVILGDDQDTSPRISDDDFIVVNDDDEDDDHAETVIHAVPPRIATPTNHTPSFTSPLQLDSTVYSNSTDHISSIEHEKEVSITKQDSHSRIEQNAIAAWHKKSRLKEKAQRAEWREAFLQGARVVTPLINDDTNWFAITNNNSMSWTEQDSSVENEYGSMDERINSLAVFNSLPQQIMGSKHFPPPIGYVNPGSTVVATQLITLESESLALVNAPSKTALAEKTSNLVAASSRIQVYPLGRPGWIQLLRIQKSPSIRISSTTSTDRSTPYYVVLSLNGYPFLGPSEPSFYIDPTVCWWRVTCPVGAFVRQGLDLSTNHIATVPYGSLVRVHKKVVSAMGLSRLAVSAFCERKVLNPSLQKQPISGPGTGGKTESTIRKDGDNALFEIEGWCSEFLNPLSGQRGLIVQPLPFPVPARYRVCLKEGAVIRSDVELSSPQIGHVPYGAILSVTGRTFSEFPTDQCVERLRLAGNGGWISCRLNRPPPDDDMIVELVETDDTFDPNQPGSYHIQAMRQLHQDHYHQLQQDATQQNLSEIGSDTQEFSSDDENDRTRTNPLQRNSNSFYTTLPSSIKPSRSQSCSEVMLGAGTLTSNNLNFTANSINHSNDIAARCLICLCEERTATLVHGETGHIACCLLCARILKAKKDPCPVCRMPIDLVIQHFWA